MPEGTPLSRRCTRHWGDEATVAASSRRIRKAISVKLGIANKGTPNVERQLWSHSSSRRPAQHLFAIHPVLHPVSDQNFLPFRIIPQHLQGALVTQLQQDPGLRAAAATRRAAGVKTTPAAAPAAAAASATHV